MCKVCINVACIILQRIKYHTKSLLQGFKQHVDHLQCIILIFTLIFRASAMMAILISNVSVFVDVCNTSHGQS
jgi:hypothetical protein